jgi:hypothetical protein
MAASRVAAATPEKRADNQAAAARMANVRAILNTPEKMDRRQRETQQQAARRAAMWVPFYNKGFTYSCDTEYERTELMQIGRMTNACTHCGALKFEREEPGMCCNGGHVKMSPIRDPPQPLRSLMLGDTPQARQFLKNIYYYNRCFTMTSFGTRTAGANQSNAGGDGGFFRIQGQLGHQSPALEKSRVPNSKGNRADFLQVYFLTDKEAALTRQREGGNRVQEETLLQLQQMLHACNRYVRELKTMVERNAALPDYQIVIRADRTPAGQHPGTFNAPTASGDVAILIVGEQTQSRDIVISYRNTQQMTHIAESHRAYDALQYPLILCLGEDSFTYGMLQQGLPKETKLTAMNFFAYQIQVRTAAGGINHLLRCRMLSQQYFVDAYARVESGRLFYARQHQREMRVDTLDHLRDAIQNDGAVNADNIGGQVILPSSFVGSPRYLHEHVQDAMVYARNFGTPDLFVTMTCNPAWEEIRKELFAGQSPGDRVDVVSRVFNQKYQKLMDLLVKGRLFGEVRCWMYSIEWQKRGLPHVHILLWLTETIRPSQIDSMICAEIPDMAKDRKLFDIVSKSMMHGPCGVLNPSNSCMKNGHCTKKYPKQLLQETQTGEDGYPLYRRRRPDDGGKTATKKILSTGEIVTMDNGWVVPYSPILCRTFDCHINIEFCNSIKSIKYILKYINKGSDQAVFEVRRTNAAATAPPSAWEATADPPPAPPARTVNEIDDFQLGRYIGSSEAVWRILGFTVHARFPTVVHLSVHLENGQRIYWRPGQQDLAERLANPKPTTLTDFFRLCGEDAFARTLLYHQVPTYFVWDEKVHRWKRRAQGAPVPGWPDKSGEHKIRSCGALGRVYSVHPKHVDCYHLRLLLHHVTGPTSFEAMRTIGGEVRDTYKEVCIILGLLENDAQWDSTMREAVLCQMPDRIINLFATLLAFCNVADPGMLWERYRDSMAEGILRQARQRTRDPTLQYTEAMYNQVLVRLEDKVLSMVGRTLQGCDLKLVPDRDLANQLSVEMLRETSYDQEEMIRYVATNEPKLMQVADQKDAYNKILNCVLSNNIGDKGIIFLDAPGGTGKTFLISLLAAKLRARGKIVVLAASSGIAATLLPGGRTAHSAFKLPLNFDLGQMSEPKTFLMKGTGAAEVLKQASLIVWDECTMGHRLGLEAVDRSLQFIRDNDAVMGGCLVLLAGDFRQILPVITRGTPADEIRACLRQSTLWPGVRILKLSTNMRVVTQGDTSAGEFAETLLKIGEGRLPLDDKGEMVIPCGNIVKDLSQLKLRVYGDLAQHFNDHAWLCERAILCPRNDMVDAFNTKLLGELQGTGKPYFAIDRCLNEDNEGVLYPTEFLNSLQPTGAPSFRLILKVGAPVILLRNLDAPRLCNGTRLCITQLQKNVIQATIMTGCGKGETVFLPRFPFDTEFPVRFRRLQFPVKLCFAMTINKAQGQSLRVAGINLETPCFSHGQLYVACSRVGTGKNLFILAPEGKTKNIVYPLALQQYPGEPALRTDNAEC